MQDINEQLTNTKCTNALFNNVSGCWAFAQVVRLFVNYILHYLSGHLLTTNNFISAIIKVISSVHILLIYCGSLLLSLFCGALFSYIVAFFDRFDVQRNNCEQMC